MRRVAIYARVSTEHEAQISALGNQIQYYDNILAQHPDWELYDRYIDEGLSGTSIHKRPNFLRMIRDAENRKFDLIITREVSRFARNTVDTLQETRNLKKLGVEVYFSEDNIWTFNDEDGELKLTLMATLAQNESKKVSQRVKAGQKISFQNGVFYGNGNILGYDYDPNTKEVTVNKEQAEIVQFMFSEYLKGAGSTEIKKALEEKGALTSSGLKKWNASSIVKTLRNPFYCGTVIYRKNYVPDYLEQKPKKNRGEVENIIVEGRHEPIISKTDFEKVQKIMNERRSKLFENKKNGVGVSHELWTKKLVCSCGCTFNKLKYHLQKDGTFSYCFQCRRQKLFGSKQTRLKKGLDISDSCDTSLVQEWKLNAMANLIFNTIWNDKEKIIDIVNEIIDENLNNENFKIELDNEIEENKIKIENLKQKQKKLLDTYLSDVIDKNTYINRNEEFELTINKYFKINEELKNKKFSPTNELDDKINKLKKDIEENLNNTENLVSDELIDLFVQKIKIKPNHYEWKLNYLDDIFDNNINNEKNDFFLTRILFTQDVANRYLIHSKQFKFFRVKEPIKIDIYL